MINCMMLTQMNPKELAASAVVTHDFFRLVCDRGVKIFLAGRMWMVIRASVTPAKAGVQSLLTTTTLSTESAHTRLVEHLVQSCATFVK